VSLDVDLFLSFWRVTPVRTATVLPRQHRAEPEAIGMPQPRYPETTMNHPSPAEPRETSIVRKVLITTGIASGSLIAGAIGMWLLVTVVRFLVHFVQNYWPWLVGVLVLVTVIFGAITVLNELAKQEAHQREERLKTIARFERVDVMTGTEFEQLIAELLCRDGYRDVAIIGRSGDRGVDITAHTPDGRKVAVQCKRQARNVPPDRIRNLIGAVHSTYSGHLGVLVTNAGYTAQAQSEGRGRLVMIGREDLGSWMAGTSLEL
jgi:restriction system protein